MKKLVLGAMLMAMVLPIAMAAPAFAQAPPKAKAKTARVDPCAPIGQTANRELVYSMSCNALPAPPPLPPQAEVVQPAPAPEPEAARTGLFGMSYDRNPGTGGQGRGH